PRGLDRAVDVLRARLREDPDRLARRRAKALERLAPGGVDPLAVDVVPELARPRRRRHGGESSYEASVFGKVPGIRARRRSRISRLPPPVRPARRSCPSRRSTITVTSGLSL